MWTLILTGVIAAERSWLSGSHFSETQRIESPTVQAPPISIWKEISAGLCKQIIAEGSYEGVDAEGVSLTLECLFGGFWLNTLMYPE
ncbi:hypothetical protein LP7551_04473 [Roseibium album]|nr:hypothetical protein LP7551_04473 [Roseibium album]